MDAASGAANRSVRIYARFLFPAVLAGALYTFSPLAAWFAVWMAFLVRGAVSGTGRAERRWLIGLLGVAVVLRVVAIGVLPFLVDPAHHAYASYFGDAFYAIQRSIWIRDVFLGVPVAPRDYIEAFEPVFGWSGYNYVLAFLHLLFGPSPYGIALFSAGLFLTAAVMLYRQCRAGFGSLAAFVGLAALLALPSWFAWSVAPLKETMEFFLLAFVLIGTIAVLRERWMVRAWAAPAVVLAIFASGLVRNGGAALAILGSGFGAALWAATRRWRIAAALALAIPLVAISAAQVPQVQAFFITTVREAAIRHLGHMRSTGFSYRLLDDSFYMDPAFLPNDYVFALTGGEEVRFLARSVIAFFVIPVPWHLENATWLVMMPQQALWYSLVLLAVAGAVAGARRDPLLTCVLAGFIVGAVIVIAPNSGNVGTLIRHRDMVVPFVAALAGMGAVKVAMRLVME